MCVCVCVCVYGQCWYLLTPSGWQHYTNIHLAHKHAKLRIISKTKKMCKRASLGWCLTQGRCLLSSHLTKLTAPGNAVSSLGEKNFGILYLHTGSLSRIEISICSQLMPWWFRPWMSLATSHLGILRVTWVWKLVSFTDFIFEKDMSWL